LMASRAGDIWWGAQLESFMARNNFQIMGGNHGATNSSLLGGIFSPFDHLFSLMPTVAVENLDSRLERCPICGNHYIKKKKRCPRCNG